ncbi:hypothetical protein AU196_17140 [Mycobacterium sp. IS-1742]|uniref:LppA family lipoprotein n=1 Tax=Mycobacterium sp. IS-1742 TaxID=1772285 RepID=UPI000740302A|nr:LppA family lipoprotein [Mycobacterium sp. IS-1742]KUI28317.1 hypothetical protein AU196_17140 [Mycobacterium sp. IS-1742]
MTARRLRWTVAPLAVLMVAACGGGSGDESPMASQEVPKIDIAQLPDIEQTRTQMTELVDSVRAEVARLVPESAPWTQSYEESRDNCTQQESGQKGTALYLAKWTSPLSMSDAQWNLVFPAVQRLAADAGLSTVTAMADSSRNHDVRLSSDDGRTLVFGSKEASLLTGSIACRRPAAGAP